MLANFLVEIVHLTLKSVSKIKVPRRVKTIFKRKKIVGRHTIPSFKMYLVDSNQDSVVLAEGQRGLWNRVESSQMCSHS